MQRIFLPLLAVFFLVGNSAFSQKRKKAPDTPAPSVAVASDSLYKSLKWRNIGPFRGGRSVAAVGVPGNPLLYYMGTVGGGIWKTEDAGLSWSNITDGFLKTSSVGAIAVAPSDPNVLYVGMGEHAIRGVMTSHGDGVYKSTDAGKTWKHLGLPASRHIASVRIHPQNPDVVYVAVQGAAHAATEERGVYKTEDGGKTWTKILYVDTNTGCADLSMDATNPRILYAGMWDHRRLPWKVVSGGPGSGLYKSTDGGESWTKLSKGLPKEMGKVAVSVSPANPQRVYANIEAEGEKGGVYRSDDGGQTWTQTTNARVTVARAWYYIEIEADPKNPDVVYCINAPLLKSIDGGKTFVTVRSPHGDNHGLWINPQNPQNMINANDGGANISFNGGASWSTQENQPTAQFYRVIADKQFPYWVYGGQQDNSSVMITSRTTGPGIGWQDFASGPGGESAFIAFDPENPELIYGGSYQGNISVLDKKTGEQKDIMAYPTIGLAEVPKYQKYRFNWNAPIVASPQIPSVIYHGANVLLRSRNQGQSWDVISPDLTRNDTTKQEAGGGPFTNEGAGGEVYNTLAYVAVSPHRYGVIWTGSDCGLVHVTQDDGASWQQVTPPDLGECLINSIEVSPHNPAAAYVVATKYRFNDFSSHIFYTNDFGKSWKKIVRGIAPESYARVVREDPVRKDLLYAGTETGLYVSYDGGENWTSFQLNLPVVPINDLFIRDNDLLAATSGRAFWILDDLSPLQQANTPFQTELKARLITPRTTIRLDGPSIPEPIPGYGQNPMAGVLISYFLPKDLDSATVTLDVLDAGGKRMLRSFTNQKDLTYQKYEGGPAPQALLPTKKGINRMAWNLRREALPGVDKVFVNGDYRGSLVGPGTYTLRLIADGDTSTTSVKILPDPRLNALPADFEAQQLVLTQAEDAVREMHQAVNAMRRAKGQIEALEKPWKADSTQKEWIALGKEVVDKITAWEDRLISPKQKTFQDVINFQNRLNAELLDLRDRAGTHNPAPTAGINARLKELLDQWQVHKNAMQKIVQEDIERFNALYKARQLPAVVVTDEK
ncbi:WD40/YVTN/BNR-like repeat-containing protein [Arundinibacter roseus]|uniref:Glycosyl hydrolase n=1 Tax=Arundinibacter roseus TaxID=2070510 RepID=A0A4R4KLN5_9BACT|nr:glycosyl hydrolase [Arundinibacter roseus]TDB68863.1 glycosyl hydrolase [Arundinibacter roseus]